jgi:heme/copper-type cytochrome/quinol oxidase subunit 4
MSLLKSKEGFVWTLLVGLTLLSYFFAEGSGQTKTSMAFWVLALGMSKFALIAYFFMELDHAHPLWIGGMLIFLLGVGGGIYGLM